MIETMTFTEALEGLLATPGVWSRLGYAGAAELIDPAGLYLRDTGNFLRAGLARNDPVGRIIDRPDLALTHADRERRADRVDNESGDLYHDGSAYVETSSLPYRLLSLSVRDFLAAAQEASRNLYDRKLVLLNRGKDFDMMTAGADYWNGVLTGSYSNLSAPPSKVTTAGNVFQNEQSLFYNLSLADGYGRGEAVSVRPGETYAMPAIVRVDGRLSYRIWDASNLAYIDTGQEQDFNGPSFVCWERKFQAPANCFKVAPHFQGLTATTDIYVDGVGGPYNSKSHRFELSDWFDASFALRCLRVVNFEGQIQGYNGIGDAESMNYIGDLQEPSDYAMQISERAVNPSVLNLKDSQDVKWAMGKPIWVAAQRTRYDAGETFTGEASTTSAPRAQFMAMFKHQVAQTLAGKQSSSQRWKDLVQETRVEQAIEDIVRHEEAHVERRQFYNLRA